MRPLCFCGDSKVQRESSDQNSCCALRLPPGAVQGKSMAPPPSKKTSAPATTHVPGASSTLQAIYGSSPSSTAAQDSNTTTAAPHQQQPTARTAQGRQPVYPHVRPSAADAEAASPYASSSKAHAPLKKTSSASAATTSAPHAPAASQSQSPPKRRPKPDASQAALPSQDVTPFGGAIAGRPPPPPWPQQAMSQQQRVLEALGVAPPGDAPRTPTTQALSSLTQAAYGSSVLASGGGGGAARPTSRVSAAGVILPGVGAAADGSGLAQQQQRQPSGGTPRSSAPVLSGKATFEFPSAFQQAMVTAADLRGAGASASTQQLQQPDGGAATASASQLQRVPSSRGPALISLVSPARAAHTDDALARAGSLRSSLPLRSSGVATRQPPPAPAPAAQIVKAPSLTKRGACRHGGFAGQARSHQQVHCAQH